MSAATAAAESRDGKAAEAPAGSRRRSQSTRSRKPARAPRKVATPPPDSQAEEAAEARAGAEAVAIPSAGSLLAGMAKAAGQGRSVARETAKLGFEAARIVGGRSK